MDSPAKNKDSPAYWTPRVSGQQWDGLPRAEPGAEQALAQPLNDELVQLAGRVQWNPMAGVVDLRVAPGSFHEASDIFMRSPSR